MIGREPGKAFLRPTLRSTVRGIEPVVPRVTEEGAAVHTGEWHAYDDLDDRGRTRCSVHHKRREWARDDEEDGVREVHTNAIEGFWLGLRNELRPFRGVRTLNLDLHLAFYEGTHHFRRDRLGSLHAILRPGGDEVRQGEGR